MQTIIGSQFPVLVSSLINDAKQSIDIIVYEWRYYPQDPGCVAQKFNESVIQAARRGVKVRALVHYAQILKYLRQNQVEAKQLNTEKLLHCKILIIDDKIAIVGSHNYTQNAFTINFELSMLFAIDESNNDIITFFNNLWQR